MVGWAPDYVACGFVRLRELRGLAMDDLIAGPFDERFVRPPRAGQVRQDRITAVSVGDVGGREAIAIAYGGELRLRALPHGELLDGPDLSAGVVAVVALGTLDGR